MQKGILLPRKLGWYQFNLNSHICLGCKVALSTWYSLAEKQFGLALADCRRAVLPGSCPPFHSPMLTRSYT